MGDIFMTEKIKVTDTLNMELHWNATLDDLISLTLYEGTHTIEMTGKVYGLLMAKFLTASKRMQDKLMEGPLDDVV